MRLFLSLLAISIVTQIAVSQSTETAAPNCDVNLATQLVRQQVRESSTITANDKQIRILIRSADFLWKYDEQAARDFFADAFKRAEAEHEKAGDGSKARDGFDARFREQVPDHRMDVIRAVAKHDAKWADQLIARVIDEYKKNLGEAGSKFREREIDALLGIAIAVAANDRDLARTIFRRVMAFPLTMMMGAAISSISQTDKELSDSLYVEALARYRDERPRRLLFLSAYPFAQGRIMGIDKFQFGFSIPVDMEPNKPLQRLIIETFLGRVARFAANQSDLALPPETPYKPEPLYLVTGLNDIEPIVISEFPDLLDRLAAARSQALALLDAEMRKTLESSGNHVEQLSMSLDERIAAAIEADKAGKLTDEMIIQLITWGEASEEQLAKIQPFLDKIKDEKAKKEASAFFWFKRGLRSVKDERFDDAEKHAERIGDLELKAYVYFELADKTARSANDQAAKFEILNKLSKVIRAAPDSVVKAQMLLGLSGKYGELNHTIALDEISESIKVVNKLKDPDLLSNFVMKQIATKDMAFFASYSIPGFDLERAFGDLSKRDMDMALAHARSFDDRFFRTLAVIAIAKQCVAAPKPQTAI
ncbi:MAG: hypothetical protein IPM50_02335 [Acidobacteriota bacterium]|nr:MAG: hypothetical protein IPM50_02335 [Acidobacteriota bacterium]